MLGEPGNEGVITRAVRKLFEAKKEIEELTRGESKVELSVEVSNLTMTWAMSSSQITIFMYLTFPVAYLRVCSYWEFTTKRFETSLLLGVAPKVKNCHSKLLQTQLWEMSFSRQRMTTKCRRSCQWLSSAVA